MIVPAIPANDEARVAALRKLEILDTPPEDRFDRLTQIAMTALQTPMASVSLIDKDRQFCKSSPGMGKGDVARSMTFCGHTILQKEPLIVNDALTDERFHDNPVVTNNPGVRAYIGVPLFSQDGYCIGSLCVVDTRQREFTPDQVQLMQSLAVVVQNEITNFVLNESLHEARSARRCAEAADLAKGKFLAVVSHEIRTPLNGIIGITDLLAGTKLDQMQQEYVNIVHASGNTLLALINDILDFSKIEAGKLELESTAIEVRRFLKETLSIHLHTARAKGIEIRNTVGDEVPVAILGDVFRLRQVLLNLVGNALKFTKEGEIEVTLGLDDAMPEPHLLFRIRDTGAGMPPEALQRLFQPFQQADSTISRTHGGTGLGLAVCKQLVELMGGKIWVESVLNQGSVFAFTIPLHECGGESLPLPPQNSHTSTGKLPVSRSRPQLRVLVVDDNSINLKVAALVLDKLGCRTECVSSGPACLEKLESTPYDVILMDMEMPEMSGCETTYHIRERMAKNRPWIVAITANVGKGTAAQCAEAGMDDYLTKPLRLEPLRVAMERFEHSRH